MAENHFGATASRDCFTTIDAHRAIHTTNVHMSHVRTEGMHGHNTLPFFTQQHHQSRAQLYNAGSSAWQWTGMPVGNEQFTAEVGNPGDGGPILNVLSTKPLNARCVPSVQHRPHCTFCYVGVNALFGPFTCVTSRSPGNAGPRRKALGCSLHMQSFGAGRTWQPW